ncbi:MAG: hypothetical protein A2201_07670 [Alicyclobacillus sp. RIFOXYA1_FULL_53_8]|nr:MAG: hypothetical protein A2201_07670 [Alicyclobacillus sp. RIFOXYA1_FULL_53_8]
MQKHAVFVLLSITLFTLVGCDSPRPPVINSPPSKISDFKIAPTENVFTLSDPTKVPASATNKLIHNSAVPCVAPKFLPRFQPPMPSGYELAVQSDNYLSGYELTFFWRPKNSGTSEYTDATLVGFIEGTKQAPKGDVFTPPRATKLSLVHLPGGILSTEYEYDVSAGTKGADTISWRKNGWVFLVSDFGVYETATLVAATAIANFVDTSQDTIVPGAKNGFVEARWEGNRPLFKVTWTYTGNVWYSAQFGTLLNTLNIAHTIRVIN